jgi:hypothetical protein
MLSLLLLVPLGEVTPRWWWQRRTQRWWWLWWRWTRWWWWWRTDAPLCALGLGASLLGPTSSPLTLLGGSKQMTRRHGAADIASLAPTPWCHLGQRNYLQPFCPCPRGGGRGGGAGSHAGRLGASSRRIRDPNSVVGGPIHRSSEPSRRSRRRSAAWPGSSSSNLGHRKAQGCPRGGLGTQGRRTHQ